MAPIKFEEQLKDKLEKRSLQPSESSWAKLSQRLETEEKTSKTSWFWWMGIAAGIIILIAVALQFFSPRINENIIPQMVNEDVIEQHIAPKQPHIDKVKATKLALEEKQSERQIHNVATEKQQQAIYYKPSTNKSVNTQLVDTKRLKHIEKPDAIQLKEDLKNLVEQPLIIKTAVAEAIDEFKIENSLVTDSEVDSLLKLASKELFQEKLKKESSKTVDASSLLLEVEEEMGQSFRTKVYEALKESYETVKTAVAERNN